MRRCQQNAAGSNEVFRMNRNLWWCGNHVFCRPPPSLLSLLSWAFTFCVRLAHPPTPNPFLLPLYYIVFRAGFNLSHSGDEWCVFITSGRFGMSHTVRELPNFFSVFLSCLRSKSKIICSFFKRTFLSSSYSNNLKEPKRNENRPF